jgi:tetratricopeptide (TPR) repeat protein
LLSWKTASSQPLLLAGSTVALLLPLAPGSVNWDDCEQRGHLFGYYFGHDMFEPHPGLKPIYASMDRDAVLYGGTDPGRFVPTYMIFCESRVPSKYKYPLDPNFDRSDVYIITQNALADNTYMNYIRDHYAIERPSLNDPATLANRSAWQRWMFKFGWYYLGRDSTYPKEPIWIPNTKKVEEGFQEYVKDVQKRGASAGENVRIENGKVSIQGVQGVMAINGIISKMIFDANKAKHSFYVEESYVIGWMYPYLEPFQIIMKINREPLPRLTPEIVKRDREFWDQYTGMLTNDVRFARDEDAKKSFSKLRTAIAGLYSWRGVNGQPELNAEAEYAFRQALKFSPDSPETNFRFVELLSRLERFDDALDVLAKFRKLDPLNSQILRVEENVRNMKKNIEDQAQWEERYKLDPNNVDVCLHLIQYYLNRGRFDLLDPVVDNVVRLPAIATNQLISLAQLYVQHQRFDRVAMVLDVLTKRYPQMTAAWYDLAVVSSVLDRGDAALAALEQAVHRGGDQFRKQAKEDPRLTNLRTLARYKEIVGE